MNFNDPYCGRDARKAVGDAVAFIPAPFVHYEHNEAPVSLSGRVIYVNDAHRHYTVEAPCNGYKIRESFMF